MEEDATRDLDYISDPFKWIQFFCPLKTRNGPREHAYMVGDGPNIYHGNMWDPKPTDRKETFASYRAIVEAGWVVD
jgi:hypothetical protein